MLLTCLVLAGTCASAVGAGPGVFGGTIGAAGGAIGGVTPSNAATAPAQPTTDLDDAGACTAIDTGAQLLAPADIAVRTLPDRTDLDDQPRTTIVTPDAFDVDRELRPGDSFTCIVTIRNRRATRTTYDIEPVGQRGRRGGGTEYVEPGDDGAGATAAAWIDPVKSSIALAPNQIGEVPVVVTVPPDPPRGSAYGSVLVLPRTGASAAGGDASVGVRSGAGVAMLLRVGGKGTPRLAFRDVRAPLVRSGRATWTWRSRLEDAGTLHAVPRGRVRVRSIFGRTVATMPIETRILLPAGSEPVRVTWKDTPWFGIYRYDARVDARGAKGSEPARADGWIIALPPWWIVAVALVVAAVAIAWPIVRRQREYRSFLEEVEHELDDPAPEVEP